MLMKHTLLLFFLLAAAALPAQDIPFIKADQVLRWKNADNDTLYVLNFWATWCAPCVAELPAFEKLHEQYADKNVKVVLISNDFKRRVENGLKPFVYERKLKSQVMFMDEPTPNTWLFMVNKDWSGIIPATLIVSKRRGVEVFFEKPLEYEELEQLVRGALKK